MHPDDYKIVYDYEWPKTAEDFAKLFAMKSFDLQEIYMIINKVDGKWYTEGIKFIFHGDINPITFGKLDGKNWAKAIFKSSK